MKLFKNNLLDVAKQQIINLETKLKSFMEYFDSIKNNNENLNKSSSSNRHLEVQLKVENSSLNWSHNGFDDKKLNNPNLLINTIHEILSKKPDSKLNTLLQVFYLDE